MEVDKKAFKSFMRNSWKVSMNSISSIIRYFYVHWTLCSISSILGSRRNQSRNLLASSSLNNNILLKTILITCERSQESLWFDTKSVQASRTRNLQQYIFHLLLFACLKKIINERKKLRQADLLLPNNSLLSFSHSAIISQQINIFYLSFCFMLIDILSGVDFRVCVEVWVSPRIRSRRLNWAIMAKNLWCLNTRL